MRILRAFLMALCFGFSLYSMAFEKKEPLDIAALLNQLQVEISNIRRDYNLLYLELEEELSINQVKINRSSKLKQQVRLLIQKDHLKTKLRRMRLSEVSDISRIRYLKGIQIIKILYEKLLSLDHHFSSTATYNEIHKLGNPNHYPEFLEMKKIISEQRQKRQGYGLTKILGDNIYTSVLHALLGLYVDSSRNQNEKERSLQQVECILDFTLRMHNDLNIIYFETTFLQKSNRNRLEEVQQLFLDYTKPIKYVVDLKSCREKDDWSTIKEFLDKYLKGLNLKIIENPESRQAHRMQINLEFTIDRLLQFITQYNSHIHQGAKFYEKFEIMLNSYEHQNECASKIPTNYISLQQNIQQSTLKFNTAYKPVEINGSKMKQLLYGIHEYD